MSENQGLPDGCVVKKRVLHTDDRGWLFEGFRQKELPVTIGQISIFGCKKGSLKGMRVHVIRHDYFIPVAGRFVLGLVDLRRDSATFGQCATLVLTGSDPHSVYVPPGIGHGVSFPEDASYLNGFCPEWDAKDEIAFRYDDPALSIDWELDDPLLAPKDKHGMSFNEAVRQFDNRNG